MLPVPRKAYHQPQSHPSRSVGKSIPLSLVPEADDFVCVPKTFADAIPLPPTLLARIFSFVNRGDRLSVLCACRQFEHVALQHVWCPWQQQAAGLTWAAKHNLTAYFARWWRANASFDPSERANMLLTVASENGSVAVVKLLLSDVRVSAAANAQEDYSLRWAARKGHTQVARLLLQCPCVDPAAQDNSPLRNAAKQGHYRIVKSLLRTGRVDVTACDNFALVSACEGGHTKVVQLLLRHPLANPNAQDGWAIRYAAEGGHIGVLQLLLHDSRTRVPPDLLKLAAQRGQFDVVRILVFSDKCDLGSLKGATLAVEMLRFVEECKREKRSTSSWWR